MSIDGGERGDGGDGMVVGGRYWGGERRGPHHCGLGQGGNATKDGGFGADGGWSGGLR